MFCQNRLISATEEVRKEIQDVQGTVVRERESVEGLIEGARELIETVRGENNTQMEKNMANSLPPHFFNPTNHLNA